LKIYNVIFLILFSLVSTNLLWAQDDTEENVIAEKESIEQLKEEERFLNFESFFIDAVQQRATDNYNKALETLTKCENIFPNQVAMLFEKAKNHFSLNQYIEAHSYCDKALTLEPTNFWIRSLKKEIFLKQRNLPEALSLQRKLYQEKSFEAQNLLDIYYQLQDIEQGKLLLQEIDKNAIYVERLRFYKNYFETSNEILLNTDETSENNKVVVSQTDNTQELAGLLTRLQTLETKKNYQSLWEETQKALVLFPTQAMFYYFQGKAQNELKNYKEAAIILENGLDFVIDDDSISKKIYEEIIKAHTALGNTTKVNSYKQLVQKLK